MKRYTENIPQHRPLTAFVPDQNDVLARNLADFF